MPSSWIPFSSSSKPAASVANMAHKGSRAESTREDSTRSAIGNNKRELENTLEDRDRLSEQQMDPRRESSAKSKASEHTFSEAEHVRDTAQKDKPFPSSEGTRPTQPSHTNKRGTGQQPTPTHEGSHAHSSRPSKHTYYDAPSEPVPGYRRDVVGSYPQLPARDREPRRSDAPKSNTADLNITPSSQTSELRWRYEALLRECESVRSDLRAKNRSLEEKDSLIKTLDANVSALQRKNDEQSTVLASVRHELQSCQSQLDNVQRFISTADTHADLDIIQKLQELNEEVYKMSMTMADRVAEGFTRQMGECTPIGKDVVITIGEVLLDYLATLGVDDDVALYLQIAFQAYLSHLLSLIVSSWTIDRNLNTVIEGTYQRLRSAETQAISGRWRCLTRTHILPTFVSDPKFLVDHAMVVLSDIVVAAGLSSRRDDVVPKLSSEFGEKIFTIVSHAGRFGSMMSEMISGEFSVFAVHPGVVFDRECMVDMTEDSMSSQGMREAETVLCVSRVGLKKQTGEKTITLTKAEVVLKSFLIPSQSESLMSGPPEGMQEGMHSASA